MVIYNFSRIAFIIYNVIEECNTAFCLIISRMPGIHANKITIHPSTNHYWHRTWSTKCSSNYAFDHVIIILIHVFSEILCFDCASLKCKAEEFWNLLNFLKTSSNISFHEKYWEVLLNIPDWTVWMRNPGVYDMTLVTWMTSLQLSM